ncbi:hypothetical protein [Xylanimonas sp. McL0601]|uniref:hypothetical protein n=1 Tax=Xylanimonas sp. McL0601 TaxID=3414739 RepID=UPI003CF2E929
MSGESVSVPMAVASSRGVSWLAREAGRHRVVLTSHGRPAAVVDAVGRADAEMEALRTAVVPVLEWAATHLPADAPFDLSEVWARLGIERGA